MRHGPAEGAYLETSTPKGMEMTKLYVVGMYAEAGNSLLNPDGATLQECRRSIAWQGEGGNGNTVFRVCKPSDRVGVMVDAETGEEFRISVGPFTEKAHARHLAEIWPVATRLFNCCTDGKAPDWSQYSGLELGGCETVEHDGETWRDGGISRDKAEFFSVYGRLVGGECEPITDTAEGATFAEAEAIAEELRRISGLPLDIRC